MTADVNVTEKVARWLFAALAPRGTWEAEPEPVREGYRGEARNLLTFALADPDVLAGIAGVLGEEFPVDLVRDTRNHSEGYYLTASSADRLAAAVVEWLRGRAL